MSFQLTDSMSIMDVFYESFESVDVKESIASSRISISEFLIENYCDFIHISIARSGQNFCGWMVYDSDELDDDDELKPMTVGDTVFEHSEIQGTQLLLYHENRFVGAIALLKYLFEIFTGRIEKSSFVTGTRPTREISDFLVNVFRFNCVALCEKVTMFQNGISSKSMIDQILDLATGMKHFDMRLPLPDDWSNAKVLQLDSLISWPTEWLTRNDLLTNLDCLCANLNETPLKSEDFIDFMRKWKTCDDFVPRLRILEVSFDGDWSNFDCTGLGVKKWNPAERDSHYPDHFGTIDADWFNCELASDIQRDDGLLASFWRREQSFHFVVWHNRFPIATLHPNPNQLVKLEDMEFASDDSDESGNEDE